IVGALALGASFTVIVVCPECPSLVAVTVTVPGATAVAITEAPVVAERETFAGAELVHVTVRPVSAVLLPSRTVAARVTVSESESVRAEGATLTEATGIGMTLIGRSPF